MPDEGGSPPDRDGSRREFVSEAEEILERLSDGLRELERVFAAGTPHLEAVNTIFRETHSLKGFAGLLGFPDIASLAHELEDLLSRLRLGGALDGTILDLVHESLDALFEVLGCVRSGAPARGDLGTVSDRLRRATATLVPSPVSSLDGVDLPPGVLASLTEFEERRLRELRGRGRRLALVRLRVDTQRLEDDLAEATRRTGEMGEVIATLPMAAGPDGGVALELLVTSERPLRPDDWPRGLVSGIREIAAPGGHVAAGTPGSGGPPVAAMGEPEAQSGTLRIPVSRLDDVLVRAGDLSIAVAALEGGVRAISERDPEDRLMRVVDPLLRASATRLKALQRGVIDARLVPLEQVFRKVGRLVARTARAAGKEADLHKLGADTEIDKAVMDALAPPLMHLTTNALDHGIEPPEERQRAGKARRGRMVLSACRRGPSVVIDVIDDGRGIALEAVRAAAETRALIAPGKEITRDEAWDLIFRPGFSTAGRVSVVSGRGVGLDVVRRSLRRLKGAIEVRSVEGQGTTFTLTVPISLALVPAIIVRSMGRRFAIPVGSIRENLRLDGSRLRAAAGDEIYDHPAGPLRLLRLDRLLAGRSSVEPGGEGRYALVAGGGARRTGIIVDDLLGRQDVVVKPLGRWLRDRPGIAGATDLGDAGAVLVLDPEALVAGANDGRARS